MNKIVFDKCIDISVVLSLMLYQHYLCLSNGYRSIRISVMYRELDI